MQVANTVQATIIFYTSCMLHTAGSERVEKCESSSTGENVNETCEGKEHRKNSHKAKPGPHPHGGTDYIQRNIEVHVHTEGEQAAVL